MSRFRPRISYANVVATLALVLAASGGAYAATQLPKNSVGSKQIEKNATAKPAPGAAASRVDERRPG
jgi:hypothetical protein